MLRYSALVYLFFATALPAPTIYLGVSTGKWTDPRPRTAYSWVHLRPVNSVLTMVADIMSYSSPGIIVGTTTLVPERAAWALVTIADLACFSRRPRN
jgi:hypothetical protein